MKGSKYLQHLLYISPPKQQEVDLITKIICLNYQEIISLRPGGSPGQQRIRGAGPGLQLHVRTAGAAGQFPKPVGVNRLP